MKRRRTPLSAQDQIDGVHSHGIVDVGKPLKDPLKSFA
jgi:hypothetical protein